jgi:transcriptional regulator with XRE-family HTH domain
MTTERDNTMTINKCDFVRAKMHEVVSPCEALKMLRELQNLTQEELAKISGITQSNISAIENGSRQLGRERAIILAKALHVHPAVLLFPDFDMAELTAHQVQISLGQLAHHAQFAR